MSHLRSAEPSRLVEFEVMRGVAALQVLAVHYEYSLIHAKQYVAGPGLIGPYFPGAAGMVLFFVLSGFVIAYSYLEKLRNRDHRGIAPYLAKRYVRLWPLHVTTLVFAVPFVSPGFFGNGWSLLANLTLMHAVFPADGPLFTYNGVSWSIGVEIVCYLAFVLIAVFTRWLGSVVLGVLGLAGIYIAYQGFTPWSASLASCSAYVGCGFQVMKYGAAFLLGLSLFLVIRDIDLAIGPRPRLRYVLKIASFCVGVLFVTYGYLQHLWIDAPVVPINDVDWLTLSAWWIALAYFARDVDLRPLRLTPLYWVGVASYSVYLWHQIVVQVVDRIIGSAIAYPLAVVVTLGLAAASYRLIEQPPRRWLAARLARR